MTKLLKTALVPILLVVTLGISLLAANAASITSSVRGEHTTTKKEYVAATSYHGRVKQQAQITIYSVGDRYVRAAIPIKGSLSGTSGKTVKRLFLQKWNGDRWVTRDVKSQRRLGTYKFDSRRSLTPGKVKFRTLVKYRGRLLDKSNVLTVKVIREPITGPDDPQAPETCQSHPTEANCPKPADVSMEHVVDGKNICQRLLTEIVTERQDTTWVWSSTALNWVSSVGPWTPISTAYRYASARDCLSVVAAPPAGAALPDIRPKSLVKCNGGDLTATGGDCFLVDRTSQPGKVLLKFPVITLNLGDGPSEFIADRSDPNVNKWQVYQNYYDASGNLLGSVDKSELSAPVAPNATVKCPTTDTGVRFYFAGDGHNHWHICDFDYYQILNTDGSPVINTAGAPVGAEKHGYCLQDNKTWDPWFNGTVPTQPGVPADTGDDARTGAYWESTSCGVYNPRNFPEYPEPDTSHGLQALQIVHGLSKGWGDTYPSTLPDQAIDITGLTQGQSYIVQVKVDQRGVVTEKPGGEDNNIARVTITLNPLVGDGVTVDIASACGGVVSGVVPTAPVCPVLPAEQPVR